MHIVESLSFNLLKDNQAMGGDGGRMRDGFRILNKPVAALQIQKLMYLRSGTKEHLSYIIFHFNLNSKNNGTVLLF